MIAILDYGIGNLKSIYNMFKKVGIESTITSDIHQIEEASKYVLPGVGSFDHGMNSLKAAPFFNILEDLILEKRKPVLGICLGMQLLTKTSDEGVEKGLGWIDAQTIKFDLDGFNLSVPHMGWNETKIINPNPLFAGLEESRFYFVHSYHVVCNQQGNILATTKYGKEFVCSIHQDNIYGVQFHPEKSHKYGMQLLKNFGDLI
jgi:glutamine amidotransferase